MTSRRRGPLRVAATRGVLVVLLFVTAVVVPTAAGARPYVPSGAAITGGDDAGGATPLRPGVHVDSLARGATGFAGGGSARYYAIAVRAGQTPYVAATVAAPAVPPEDGRLGLDVSLTAQGESSTCATDSRSDFATDDRLDPVTAVVTPGRIGREGGCPAGTLVVRVERTGDAVLTTPLAVEIAYRLEPAASGSGLPVAAVTAQPTLRAGLTGTPATLASGNNFTSAPLVGTGIYKDSLTAGDTRIVRVHLDWGQRFAYTVTSSERPGVTSDDSVQATSVIRNPLRQVADQASGSSATAVSLGSQDVMLSGTTAVPVGYRNRESDSDTVARYATAGDYYLVLGTDVPRDGDATLRYPYTLQLQVFGDPQPGPSYAGVSGPVSPRAPDGGGTGPVVALIAAGGVVVVGLVVLLVVVLTRRRDAQRTRQVRTHT